MYCRVCFVYTKSSGDQLVTISLVVPTVLDLHSHLKKKESVRYCQPLVAALMASLRKRFCGIFQNCQTAEGIAGNHDQPFSDKVYLIATVLDPRFSIQWVDIDVHIESDTDSTRRIRNEFKEMLQGIISRCCVQSSYVIR